MKLPSTLIIDDLKYVLLTAEIVYCQELKMVQIITQISHINWTFERMFRIYET